eukprot:GFYU01013221.1.p1 GENE.GFYU01013221.1~~GFYU01013221.1.p1  ORF type:complete len:126 (+),score=10.79 GFYU01013221.1:311-688(+)
MRQASRRHCLRRYGWTCRGRGLFESIVLTLLVCLQHGEDMAALFCTVLLNVAKEETVQYVLTLVDDVLSNDHSKAALFLSLPTRREKRQMDPFAAFTRLLNRSDKYTLEKASHIFTILVKEKAAW